MVVLGSVALAAHGTALAQARTPERALRPQDQKIHERLCHVTHTIAPGETVSTLLHAQGIGIKDAKHRLYGPLGWVERNRVLNRFAASRWNQLGSDVIHLYWPTSSRASDACASLGQEVRTFHMTSSRSYEIFLHLFEPTATASQIMMDFIKPLADPDLRLYGPNGLMQSLVPFTQVHPDSTVSSWVVALPRDVDASMAVGALETSLPHAMELRAETAREESPLSTPLPEPLQEAPSPPETAPIETTEIASPGFKRPLEKEEQRMPTPATSAEALDDPTVAQKDPGERDKSPRTSTYDETSDSLEFAKSGVAALLDSLDRATAASYLGLKYGHVLNRPSTNFMTRLQIIGLTAEFRGGWARGLRLAYDIAPSIEGTPKQRGGVEKLSFSRFLLGWSSEWKLPIVADKMHVTPRLGRYNAATTFSPIADDGTPGNPTKLVIANALSLGGETDIEWSRSAYSFRLWGGADWTPASLSGGRSVQSLRGGLDLILKGASLEQGGRSVSLSYLLFASNERLTLTDSSGSSSAEDEESIKLNFPLGGLGVLLTW